MVESLLLAVLGVLTALLTNVRLPLRAGSPAAFGLGCLVSSL